MKTKTVYVIWCRYSDGSGKPEIARVYENEERANADLALVCGGHPSVEWNLSEVPMIIED